MSRGDPSVRALLVVAIAIAPACTLQKDGTGELLALGSDVSVPDDTSESVVADSAAPETFVDSEAADTFVRDTSLPDAALPETAPACGEATGVLFEGHCYFMLTAAGQGAAKTACAAVSAHLVTVTSAREHEFLKTMGTGDRWIGLESPTPSNNRSDYRWITGEAKTVSSWYSADPDAMGPCVAMHGSLQQWVDRGCSQPNAAICERE